MAYVELGQENGGILLNLSEGGLAMRSALPLGSREFTSLRFQAPSSQGWLTASGRIVWLSNSKKEAGIQFTELPGEARMEIHQWVSAGGDPEGAVESLPASSYGGREPSKQPLDPSDRESGGTRETVIARGARPLAAQTQRERVPTLGKVGVAAAEPLAQAFRFTDYSMFAAEPEKEGAWIEPKGRRRGWGGTALLVLLVAALCFTLGSTVGRGSVDRLIVYLATAVENQLAPPPKVTPPTPPEPADAAGATEDQQVANSAPDGDQTKVEEGTNPAAGPAANSQVANTPLAEKKDEEPKAGTEQKGSSAAGGVSAADSKTRSAIVPGTNELRPRHSTESAMPRNDREVDIESSKMATEHSILVNPPGPGGRPFYVNLAAETISASAAIAISAQRTLLIQPSASGRSERVVIGTLKSHSEPFYPVEARKQRIEGSVELRARVGRTGQIIGVTPVSGPGLLASAATAAVREWRYEPTFIDGDPVETQADITIVFRLQ